jgi:acyl carrier protein
MTRVSAEQVRASIVEELEAPLRQLGFEADQVADDFDLHDSGVIDSFGLIELISAIEERFGLEVDFEQLEPEQLTVVGPLARFIEAQSELASAP